MGNTDYKFTDKPPTAHRVSAFSKIQRRPRAPCSFRDIAEYRPATDPLRETVNPFAGFFSATVNDTRVAAVDWRTCAFRERDHLIQKCHYLYIIIYCNVMRVCTLKFLGYLYYNYHYRSDCAELLKYNFKY